MTGYIWQKWPAGEALTQALADTELLLQSPDGPSQHAAASAREPQSDDEDRPAKAQKLSFCSTLKGGKQTCKDWNTKKCTKKERDCPRGHVHCCDVRLKNGKACQSRNHKRLSHLYE